MQPKRYRKRCEQQIGMSIQDTFAPLLRDCAQLMAAGENTDKRTVRGAGAGAPPDTSLCLHAIGWVQRGDSILDELFMGSVHVSMQHAMAPLL